MKYVEEGICKIIRKGNEIYCVGNGIIRFGYTEQEAYDVWERIFNRELDEAYHLHGVVVTIKLPKD